MWWTVCFVESLPPQHVPRFRNPELYLPASFLNMSRLTLQEKQTCHCLAHDLSLPSHQPVQFIPPAVQTTWASSFHNNFARPQLSAGTGESINRRNTACVHQMNDVAPTSTVPSTPQPMSCLVCRLAGELSERFVVRRAWLLSSIRRLR